MTAQLTQQLLSHLHRSGTAGYWWTPEGDPYIDQKTGEQQIAGASLWWPVEDPLAIPEEWRPKNIYFPVHPSAIFRDRKHRTRNEDVAAINCVFGEFDTKDQVTEEEYAPYLPADFDQLDEKKQENAIKDARKAAAADRPDLYKERILAHLRTLPLYPSAVVDSGGGFHCYWLLADTFTLDTDENRTLAQAVQRAWVALVGSDPDAKDLSRMLRLPGSLNHKYTPARPVHFVECDLSRLYSWQEILSLTAALRAEGERPQRNAERAGRRTYTPDTPELQEIAEALRYIPTQPGYDIWLRILMAVHSVYPGPEGIAVCEAWSPGQPGEVEKKFRSFGDGGEIGIGTLFHIAKEYGYEPSPPRQAVADREKVRAEIPALRLWLKTTSFADYVPKELQTHFWARYPDGPHAGEYMLDPDGNRILEKIVYRTDSTDTKTVSAILDLCEERGSWRVRVSLRELAGRAGLGSPSALWDWDKEKERHKGALARLGGWFCEYDPAESLLTVVFRMDSLSSTYKEKLSILNTTYTDRKADDPFLTGTSRTMREYGETLAQELGIEGEWIKDKYAPEGKRWRPGWSVALDEFARKSLGESGLRVIDVLEVLPDQDRRSLADVTEKSLSSIGSATRLLEKYGLVDVDRADAFSPKRYTLRADWVERLEAMRSSFKTYNLGVERRKRDAEQLKEYCETLLERGYEVKEGKAIPLTVDKTKWAHRAIARAEEELEELIPLAHPQLTTEEDIDAWLRAENGPRPRLPHEMDREHDRWTMEFNLYRHRREQENLAQIQEDLVGGWEHMEHYAEHAEEYCS